MEEIRGLGVKKRRPMYDDPWKHFPICGAPEIFNDEPVSSPKADMWALGIILYQMVSSMKHPFGQESNSKLVRMIESIKHD